MSYTSKRPKFGVPKIATGGPTLQEDRNALHKPYTKRPYFVLSENLNLISNTSKSSDYDLNFETLQNLHCKNFINTIGISE